MNPATTQRNEAVLAVLRGRERPIGPSDIARQINLPWTMVNMREVPRPGDRVWPNSGSISIVLKRIGAVRHEGGKYTVPVRCDGEPSML